MIRNGVRRIDTAARYGGDEFVILLPETDAAGGYVVGEKLRRDIYSLTLHAADRNVRSSVSVGLVAYPDDGGTIEQLVAAADVAMYEAKRRGKNRIVGYQMRTERVATDIDAATHDLVQLTPSDAVRTGGDPVPWGSARSDRSAILVEPDEAAASSWSTGVTEPSQPVRQPPPRRPEERPPDQPPEPPSRTITAVEAPDQPWLTRTGDTTTGKGVAWTDPLGRDHPAPGQRGQGRSTNRTDEIHGDADDQPWIALPIEPDDEGDKHRR